MGKSTHFIGQPLYSQVIKLLDKEKILEISRENGGERYIKRFDSLFRRFDYRMEIPANISKQKMTQPTMLPVNARKSNFMEINLGYTGEQARVEANRCLRCDVREHKREPRGSLVSD